jgi:hypothetical protein
MNDDYLWDKTGQPDPEIQQLEEILGTLRYQPQPLELPDDAVTPRRRSYLPLLAIAASLLLALLAGGIWLRVRSRNEIPPLQTRVETVAPKVEEKNPAPEPARDKSAVNPPVIVATVKHRKRSAASVAQRTEALEAKEQLMLALRVTTEKLSLIHKKTQIRNQHKVG